MVFIFKKIFFCKACLFCVSLAFFFAALLLPFGAQAQNQKTIQPVIRSVADSTIIADAYICIYSRALYQINNDLYLAPVSASDPLVYKSGFNSEGRTIIALPEHRSTELFRLKAYASNFDTLHITMISASDIEEALFNVFLSPKVIPNDISETLVDRQQEMNIPLTIEKSIDEYVFDIYDFSKNGPASCDIEIPEKVYVKNLYNGYNNTSCSNTGIFTGYIDFTEYIAGVISREMGGSFHPEALKAQAVAARSYSLARVQKGLPANCGQAYSTSVPQVCIDASQLTSKHVMLYQNTVINASYSARCSGIYTQNAQEGVWNPASTCNKSGNAVPYLVSRPCSGHKDCSQTSEKPCCEVSISTSGQTGFIYGHGVGMCQRGAHDFASAPNNKKWDEILYQYYSHICISAYDSIGETPEGHEPSDPCLDPGNTRKVLCNIKVSPIPATNAINISFENPLQANAWAYITDFIGHKQLYDISLGNKAETEASINVSHLKYGIYLLVLFTEEAKYSRKIVIMK